MPAFTPAALRADTVGIDAPVQTPFGRRHLVYADFTASGRQLGCIEERLRELAVLYANAHTEDSLTGRTATHLLHDAERVVKECVGAGPTGKVVACGNGSTGAIHKLQQILGIAIPPATLDGLARRLADLAAADPETGAALSDDAAGRLVYDLRESGPVVFVGPYEHHSNEVTWREGLCTVVEVALDADGQVCLDDLRAHLADPRWEGRPRIGSFCAASNVTGVVAPVHEIARVLHAHGAVAVFDYAAAGPYVEIDMTPEGDPDARLDAVFLSPHKFLGGPGSCGLLVFDERLYPAHLAPTVGGGGTVSYVNDIYHDYLDDIEARETPGTPGFFQMLRAAYAFDVKRAVGVKTIHAREHAHLARAFDDWALHDRISILGPLDADARLGIVSFNVLDGDDILHPRFVTVLLCDLFGIQSRAGCSCAGPYGHRLLDIDRETSARYRACSLDGYHGIKPGWCRVGFHYTMDDAEAGFVIDAVRFVADHGARFMPLYAFDVRSGTWQHRDAERATPAFGLDTPTGIRVGRPLSEAERAARYAAVLAEAHELAASMEAPETAPPTTAEYADLVFFSLPV